jgi:hypothetical protein
MKSHAKLKQQHETRVKPQQPTNAAPDMAASSVGVVADGCT